MRMLLLAVAGWLNEEQREKIEFVQEQIRVLQELSGGKRTRAWAMSWSMAFQNALLGWSSDVNAWAGCSIRTTARPPDASADQWNTTGSPALMTFVLAFVGFQNEGPARSPDVNDSADSSIIPIEKRHDRSIE